jgi:excisionase family DNA binding protein
MNLLNSEVWHVFKEMHEQGMTVSEIARRTGVSRPTVMKYIQSGEPPVYGSSGNGRLSILEPYKPYIRERIEGYNLSGVRILEEIKAKGYVGEYTILKNYCRTLRNDVKVKAVWRFETKPGEQAQVDYGEFGPIEIDGAMRKLHCFSILLGYSRMRYIEFSIDLKTETLIRQHTNAFQYFGGYTNSVLYDNMKQVVLDRKAKVSDSTFNQLFMDFLEFYGIWPRLCHPYRPQTKGKIENTIKFIRGNFWNGRTFTSLADVNSQALQWCDKVNAMVHRTTGEIPKERLPLEKLNPIQGHPVYAMKLTDTRKVSRDCYVSYHGNRYSVPWKHAGRESSVTELNGKLSVTVGGTVVAEHDILQGSGRISRHKEDFEGLLKTIKEQNLRQYSDVEKRDLSVYDSVGE